MANIALLRFVGLVALVSLAACEGPDFGALSATFGERLHPFATGASWAICMKAFKNITTLSATTDFGALINNSLRDLAATGGGSVLLAAGSYDFTPPIAVPTNTCIVGAGITKTTLRVKDESWPYYPLKGALYSTKTQNTSFVGFSLDGNRQNQYMDHPYYSFGRTGIYQERSSYSYLLNVRSFNHQGSGSKFFCTTYIPSV